LRRKLAIVAKSRAARQRPRRHILIGEVDGSDVLLVDDLTETAGTLTSAAELLKKRGAQKIYAGVSHAVLVDMAIQRLQKVENYGISNHQQHAGRPVDGFKITVLCVSELSRGRHQTDT